MNFSLPIKVPDLNYIISPAKSSIIRGTLLVKKYPVMNIKNLLEEYYKDDSYKLYTFTDGTFSLKTKDKIIVFTRQ
ncbi:MAG: hypothetical protein KDC92_17140 [Bacteroidetes bacterium]|nr:hypothetical protein [Bacteroidota bacterium]